VLLLSHPDSGTGPITLSPGVEASFAEYMGRDAPLENGRGSYDRPGSRRCERFDNPRSAIQREKNLERWSQAWKHALVERGTPDWRHLWPEITA
jgi:hypothetical protein